MAKQIMDFVKEPSCGLQGAEERRFVDLLPRSPAGKLLKQERFGNAIGPLRLHRLAESTGESIGTLEDETCASLISSTEQSHCILTLFSFSQGDVARRYSEARRQ